MERRSGGLGLVVECCAGRVGEEGLGVHLLVRIRSGVERRGEVLRGGLLLVLALLVLLVGTRGGLDLLESLARGSWRSRRGTRRRVLLPFARVKRKAPFRGPR